MPSDTEGRGPRVSLTDLELGETLEFPLTPPQLEHVIGANWAKQTVMGLSHTVKQFINTNDAQFTFEAFFDVLDGRTTLAQIQRAYRFLEALHYPGFRNDTFVSGGPSRFLFVWPGVLSLVCVVISVSFSQTRFAEEGGEVTQFSAKVTLEEIRDRPLSREDVFLRGLFRSGGS